MDTTAAYLLATATAMPPSVAWTDISAKTNAGGGTGPVSITAVWTVPPFDAKAGTVYTIEVPFEATMEGNQLTIGLSVNGAVAYTVAALISGTVVGAGVGLNGVARAIVRMLSQGSAATFNAFITGSCGQNGGVAGTGAAVPLFGSSRALGIAFNSTVSNNLRFNASFAAVTTGQSATGYGSQFTRTGP